MYSLLSILCLALPAAMPENGLRIFRAHERWISAVTMTADGKWIATGSDDQLVRIWHAASKMESRSIEVSAAVTSLAFSPDGKSLAIGLWDGGLQIRRPESGELVRSIAAHTENITCLSWTRDGLRLATASGDDRCVIWDMRSGKKLLTLEQGNDYDVTAVVFSPDGKQLATGDGENQIKVWDAANGDELQALAGHAETISSLAWSSDGKWIASGSWDDTVKIWDATTAKERKEIAGHRDDITSITLSGDGQTVVSASADRSVRFWDVKSGKPVCSFEALPEAATSVVLRADGGMIAFACGNKLYWGEVRR